MVALSFKHILVLIMIGISVYRSLVLCRKNRLTVQKNETLKARLLVAYAVLALGFCL